MANFILELRRMTPRSMENRAHCIDTCPEAQQMLAIAPAVARHTRALTPQVIVPVSIYE
jgi:hypothetical protein